MSRSALWSDIDRRTSKHGWQICRGVEKDGDQLLGQQSARVPRFQPDTERDSEYKLFRKDPRGGSPFGPNRKADYTAFSTRENKGLSRRQSYQWRFDGLSPTAIESLATPIARSNAQS